MPSSAHPEPARARPEAGTEPRARLFALQVDLFVNAPTRDRESLRAFEALALGFMPRLDPATLRQAAERLAPCPDTPEAVLDHLVRHSARARAAILERAPALPPAVADTLIGLGRAAALAARPGLEPALQERLLALDEPAVDEAIAGNAGTDLSADVLHSLVARAAERSFLGRALLGRAALAPEAETALYLHADLARRAAIRARLDASVAVDRVLPSSITPAEAEALLALARAGDVAGFAQALSACLGFAKDTPWRFLRRGRQPLLGLALAALGLDEAASARIALSLHPSLARSAGAAAGVTDIVRSVPRATAARLVEAILGQSIARPAGQASIRPLDGHDGSARRGGAAGELVRRAG